jgi:hypothetical protein
VANRTFGLFAEHFTKNVLMLDKKNSARLARMFTSMSQKFEKAGAAKTALWFEKRAESFDKNLIVDNFVKRF